MSSDMNQGPSENSSSNLNSELKLGATRPTPGRPDLDGIPNDNIYIRDAGIPLSRSPKDAILAGVCSGLAKSFGMEVWLMRFLWVIGICFLGISVLAYVVLAICLPREDRIPESQHKMIFGVCARLAKLAQIDVALARVIAVLLFLLSGGTAIVAYVILYFVVPSNTEKSHTK